MNRASVSHFRRSGDSDLTVWTLGESSQWLQNWYLPLPSQALSIIRIGQLAQCQDNVTGSDIRSYAGRLVSQWGSTINSPWVRTVTSRHLSWYDLRCSLDIKQQTNQCLSWICRIKSQNFLWFRSCYIFIRRCSFKPNFHGGQPYASLWPY